MSQTGIHQKTQRQGEPNMSISVLGIDIGKNNFHLFGVDADGKKVFRKKLTRKKLTELIPTLQPCLIVMEACGGAHYWAIFRAVIIR